MMKRPISVLMSEDKGGEGQGGGSSILTSPGGGGGTSTSQGASSSGENTNNGGTSTSTISTSSNTQGNNVQDWKLGLPEELQKEPSLGKFLDVSALARGYINAEKLVGADKIVLPGKHATDEDWKGIYKKLGLPEKLDAYEVKMAEGATLDEAFVGKFKEAAFNAGILPKQAQALADWFVEANKGAEEELGKSRAQSQEQAITGLKKEWGAAFQSNVLKAQKAVVQYGDAQLVEFLEKTGLGNEPSLIKLFAKIGDSIKEDSVVHTGEKGPQAMTPADAQKEIAKIMGNSEHPYYKKDHPNHWAAVQEMSKLFEMSTYKG